MNQETIDLQGVSLATFADQYIDYVTNVKARSNNTISAYSQDINCFLKYLSSNNEDSTEFDSGCITSYLLFLRNTLQLKPATVRRRILTVQGLSQWLVASGKLVSNPFEGLSLDLKVPKRLPRPVDPLTIRQLISLDFGVGLELPSTKESWVASTRKSQKRTTLLVIQLMLITGIRVGEVAAIRLQDISSDGSTIHILGKGNKERLVFIENKYLSNSLAEYRLERLTMSTTDAGMFINARGQALTPQVIRKRVKTMCLNIGTSDMPTPHRFRHSAATLLIEQGADIRVVQRLLGHASISTTELYAQVTDVSLREVLKKADVLGQFR